MTSKESEKEFILELEDLIIKYLKKDINPMSMLEDISVVFTTVACSHIECFDHMLGIITFMITDDIKDIHTKIRMQSNKEGNNATNTLCSLRK